MIRVLHLMAQSPDFQTQRAANILAQKLGQGINVTTRTIGPRGDYRNALTAYFSFAGKLEKYDLIHAWGLPMLLLSSYMQAPRLVFTPTEWPTLRSIRKARLAMKNRELHIVCSSELEREIYLEHEYPKDRCHCIPPGVDVGRAKDKPGPRLRASLGFAEEDYVLLAPGESTRAAGHHDALWAASILHVLDRRYKILLWGRGEQTGNCVRLAEKLHQPTLLTLAEEKLGGRVNFDELLPAADAVLYTPVRAIPVLPIAMCLGARLPIVSTPTPWFADILKDGENCIQVPRRSSRMLAQRVIELREDAGVLSRIAGAGRKTAGDIFSKTGFAKGYREIYRELASGFPILESLLREIL